MYMLSDETNVSIRCTLVEVGLPVHFACCFVDESFGVMLDLAISAERDWSSFACDSFKNQLG